MYRGYVHCLNINHALYLFYWRMPTRIYPYAGYWCQRPKYYETVNNDKLMRYDVDIETIVEYEVYQ